MKIRLLLSAAIICCLCGLGCKNSAKTADEFSIQGKVRGLEDKVMHLERITAANAEPLQDVKLDAKGDFFVKQKGEANTLFQLRADDGRRMLLFPEFDALEIEADADEMEAFQVTGGAKAKLFRDFNLKQFRLYIDFANAEAQLQGLDRQKDTVAWHELEGVTDRSMVAYHAFLREFCDTVQLPILRAHASLSISETGNYHYLSKLSQRIGQEMSGTSYASVLDASQMKEAEGRVGITVPSVTGTDLRGQAFDITSLRGKRVLLTFWASYCEFSRLEFAKIREMRQLFADNGVVLLCFSIDDHEAEWRKYLATAGLDWAIHLRGLNGQQSGELKLFRVTAIPSTYMINPQGITETLDIRADELAAYFKELPSTPAAGNQ